jgi:hypothetical protein
MRRASAADDVQDSESEGGRGEGAQAYAHCLTGLARARARVRVGRRTHIASPARTRERGIDGGVRTAHPVRGQGRRRR